MVVGLESLAPGVVRGRGKFGHPFLHPPLGAVLHNGLWQVFSEALGCGHRGVVLYHFRTTGGEIDTRLLSGPLCCACVSIFLSRDGSVELESLVQTRDGWEGSPVTPPPAAEVTGVLGEWVG